MDVDWLREAWRLTRKDGATGIDRVTADEFTADLERNLERLVTEAKSGSYRAPPTRRAYVPKSNGEQRAIAVPCLADKVLQKSVVMLLEPIFEHDFLDCSFGFRPGRSCHDAVEVVRQSMWDMGGGYLIEADIRKFFDTLDRRHLRAFLRERIGDGVILKLVDKWLNAGVMESGTVTHSDIGSVQGGTVSPLLANVCLHHVLDLWFERAVKPRLRGRAFLVRYCDDFVIGFARKEDAERVFSVLGQRFERYGLQLHPEKTRVVPFGRPRRGQQRRDAHVSQSFNFVGFTFCWTLSRTGAWYIRLTTAKDRFSRALKAISEWAQKNMHRPIREQLAALWAKIRGHKNYFGVRGNSRAVDSFKYFALKVWRKWLCRRSNKGYVTLERLSRLIQAYERSLRPRLVKP
jgi:group II intron reverse transcriptase/maturase